MSKSKGPKGPSRSAITGRFVTESFARKNPRTTITHKPKGPGPKGKK